jgi:hypothetical protein
MTKQAKGIKAFATTEKHLTIIIAMAQKLS